MSTETIKDNKEHIAIIAVQPAPVFIPSATKYVTFNSANLACVLFAIAAIWAAVAAFLSFIIVAISVSLYSSKNMFYKNLI